MEFLIIILNKGFYLYKLRSWPVVIVTIVILHVFTMFDGQIVYISVIKLSNYVYGQNVLIAVSFANSLSLFQNCET